MKEIEKGVMFIKVKKKWGTFALIVERPMLCSSCPLHRHTRPPRHHPPPRLRVVIIAEQTTATGQSKDCITFEECLAMSERNSYGSTE